MENQIKIYIHGQNHTLKNSGGVGRYAFKLYEKLFESNWVKKKSMDLELKFIGFKSEKDSLNAGERSLLNKIDSLKFLKEFLIFKESFKNSSLNAFIKFIYRKTNFAKNIHKKNEIGLLNTNYPMILHELTNYTTHPEIGRWALSPKMKLLVTFIDIQDYYYPEYFSNKTLKSRRLTYSFYKDRAEYFFAISEFTKQTMIDRLGIPSDKIFVTPLAADDMINIDLSDEIINFAKSFGRYWLYPAKVWKHKNHEFLIKAISSLKDIYRKKNVFLLLTGGFSKIEREYLEKLIVEYDVTDTVRILGFVTEYQLCGLYSQAEYTVFPSLFEGFGMPVLEAMTLGCPVLSSNAGSLPEIGGNAFRYFDPNDLDEAINLFSSALNENKIDRRIMIKNGYQRSKMYNWDVTFNTTKNIYKNLLS